MERQKESVGWSERETIIRHLEQRVRTLEEASQEREALVDTLERQLWLLNEELQVEREAKQKHIPEVEHTEKLLTHIGWLEDERDKMLSQIASFQELQRNIQPMWRLLEDGLGVLAGKLRHQLPETVVKGLRELPADEWQGRDIAVVAEAIKNVLEKDIGLLMPFKSTELVKTTPIKPRPSMTEPFDRTETQGKYYRTMKFSTVANTAATSSDSPTIAPCSSAVVEFASYPSQVLPRQYRRNRAPSFSIYGLELGRKQQRF